MKTLVTGGAGFIGLHLVNALLKATNDVIIIVDDFSRSSMDYVLEKTLESKRVQLISGRVEDVSLPDVDRVFHLAAINGTKRFYDAPWSVASSAGISSWRLIDRYKSEGIPLVITSTSEVYAGLAQIGVEVELPASDNLPLVVADLSNPRWSYAGGKIFSEVLAASAAKQFGTRIKVARLHNVYGSRMGNEHFIPEFHQRLLDGDFRVFGARQTRTFMHVDDAVESLIRLSNLPFKEPLSVFNVGGAEEFSIRLVAEKIKQLVGVEGELIEADPPLGSVNRRMPDCSKLWQSIGEWELVDLESGLRETFAKELK